MMKARRDIRCSSIEIIDSGCGWIPAVISYGLGLPPQKRLCRGVQSRCCLLVHFGPRRLRRRKSEMPSMADIAVLRPLRFVSPAVTESMACRPLIVAAGACAFPRQIDPTGKSSSDFRKSCQVPKAKIFRFYRKPIRGISIVIPSREEGRWPSSRTRGGLRWTQRRLWRRVLTRTTKACGPDASVLASSS